MSQAVKRGGVGVGGFKGLVWILCKELENGPVYKKEATCVCYARHPCCELETESNMLTKLKAFVIVMGDLVSVCCKPDHSDNISFDPNAIRLCLKHVVHTKLSGTSVFPLPFQDSKYSCLRPKLSQIVTNNAQTGFCSHVLPQFTGCRSLLRTFNCHFSASRYYVVRGRSPP